MKNLINNSRTKATSNDSPRQTWRRGKSRDGLQRTGRNFLRWWIYFIFSNGYAGVVVIQLHQAVPLKWRCVIGGKLLPTVVHFRKTIKAFSKNVCSGQWCVLYTAPQNSFLKRDESETFVHGLLSYSSWWCCVFCSFELTLLVITVKVMNFWFITETFLMPNPANRWSV